MNIRGSMSAGVLYMEPPSLRAHEVKLHKINFEVTLIEKSITNFRNEITRHSFLDDLVRIRR